MPTYDYKCNSCGAQSEAFRKISDRKTGPVCCDQAMKQVITAVSVGAILGGGDNPGYECSVTGEWVTSKRQRREIMARHDLVEAI